MIRGWFHFEAPQPAVPTPRPPPIPCGLPPPLRFRTPLGPFARPRDKTRQRGRKGHCWRKPHCGTSVLACDILILRFVLICSDLFVEFIGDAKPRRTHGRYCYRPEIDDTRWNAVAGKVRLTCGQNISDLFRFKSRRWAISVRFQPKWVRRFLSAQLLRRAHWSILRS